ncbi:MAG: undecaprenyldiphospho-muramoylpentapeptide beta-N-acetylglucosaminyltransferase [Deltaproteobacteria bacterium]|nr:undecaprenyldiphospho-muramoylpentapeptide beta-N-acetylglucosaminyltransferase [Deltaproteobacteria bacterium]
MVKIMETMIESRFILAAGGTGGHLCPALSLARALKKIQPEADCLFVGAGRPVEAAIVDPAGFRRVVLRAGGWKGLSLRARLKGLWQVWGGFREAIELIRSYRPRVCFGAGGYVTVPVGLAAWFLGVPLIIHEQNSRAGLSNKLLGRLADHICLGFEEAAPAFPVGRTVVTGNPVRPEIAALHEQERSFDRRPPTVLVTGGSQGARALNMTAAPVLAELVRQGLAINIIHQTGAADMDEVRRVYLEAGAEAEVKGFYQDMAALYHRTDLVIGRAGAITLSELAAARLPAVLVPLPTAADDHQTLNARFMEAAGAALVLPQAGLTRETLGTALAGLLTSPEKLAGLSRAAASLARLDADIRLAGLCLDLASAREPASSAGRLSSLLKML